MKQEIIYTNNYALIVSDEKPLYKDYYINEFMIAVRTGIDDSEYVEDYIKKIIAHRPLKDASILEGVPLLPEFSQEDVEKLAFNQLFPVWNSKDILENLEQSQIEAFKKGYNKAKETYKYTEEDLIKAIELAQTPSDYDSFPLIDEVMQSLQQSKRPKYFETVCDCQECGANKTNLSLDMGCENKIATITNSQGKVELVGEYNK